MEYISDPSVNLTAEMTPPARRRLASVALDVTGADYIKAPTVEIKSDTLQSVETGLKQRIVGQEEAIDKLVSALECAELRNPNRPIASFMFLGPTGVGKSETAKELAKLLHEDGEEAFLKIDCTEFEDATNISALVGAPPKYVGREQDPLFNPDIIEHDKSVILFDEIEKGHPKFHDLLLQILEEGEVTLLNGGQVISFRNSIIIMTSNVGSSDIMKLVGGNQIGFKSASDDNAPTEKSLESAAYRALKAKFKPEFINRIDHRITYRPLTDQQLGEVLDNYVYELTQTPALKSRNVGLTLTSEVIDEVVSRSLHREELGARPVLRTFEQTVWQHYARNITGGSIPDDSWALATLAGDNSEGTEIPVEFFYKKIPSHPEPIEVSPEPLMEIQEVIESEAIER